MQITPTNRQTRLIFQTNSLTDEVVKQFPRVFQSNGESVGSEIESCPIYLGEYFAAPGPYQPIPRFSDLHLSAGS